MFRGFKECIFLEKVNTALQNLENHKVHLKDPVRPNEGPRLVMAQKTVFDTFTF